MVLVIISFVVFLAYILGVYVYLGIPYSISDTYYKFEGRKRGLGWMFTGMCWGVALPLLPYLLDVTPESYRFVAFLACAGLMFVGAAPQFRLPLTDAVHYGAAAVCVVFSQVWVALTFWWVLIPVWLAYIVYTVVDMSRHVSGSLWDDFMETRPMFWVEVATIVAVYLCVFLK